MPIILVIITLLSLTLAAIMSGVAWRVTREERRRSDARIAALAVEIHGSGTPATITSGEAPVAVATSSDLFAAAQPGASSGSRLAAVIALGVFVVGSGAALAVVLSSGSRGVTNPAQALVGSGLSRTLRTDAASRTPRTDASGTDAPLELVALGYERDADRLTVRGVVRNPTSGRNVDHLAVVVSLFNRDGGLLASGRAAVDAATLALGADSPFVVTVPGAADVDHYRVSFRMDEGVVPHVDRRDVRR